MADGKEKIIFEIQVEGDQDLIKSLEAQKGAILALKKEQKELNENLKKGLITDKEYASELVRTEQLLKRHTREYGELTNKLQGTKSFTDKLADAMKAANPTLGALSGGVNGLTTAFKANPIGLFITALISLKGIFEANAKVANSFSDAFNFINGVTKSVVNSIVEAVSSFENLKKAIFNPIDFFKNLGTNAIQSGKDVASANKFIREQFELMEIDSKAVAKRALDQAEVLRRTRDNESKSFKERMDAARQVEGFINVREQVLVNTQKERLKNLQLLLSQDKENLDLQKEIKLVELEIADIEEDSQGKRTEALNGIIALQKEYNDEKKKQRDQELKDLDTYLKNNPINAGGIPDESIEANKALQRELELTKLAIIDVSDESIAADQSLQDYYKTQAQAEINAKSFSASLGQLSSVMRQESGAQKLVSSSQALVNTYLAGTQVLKQNLPFPLNIIAMASTIAAGLGTVAKINGVQGFASGGLTGKRITSGDGVSISRSNGDNLLATVRTGEVILNERQQAALGGSATFARLGVPGFANGGVVAPFETQFISNQVSSEAVLRSITRAITNQPQKVAIIEEIQALNTQTVQIKEMATI